MSSSKLQDAHNQGQTDKSNGVYTPPNRFAEEVGGAIPEEADEIRGAYDQGHSDHDPEHRMCFLTTACTQAAGLADDCHELTVLREFRDTFVRRLPNGDSLISEYYQLSPQIVPKLSAKELRSIYTTVRQVVVDIGCGEHDKAFATYAALFNRLRDKYVAT